jgi:ferredoxin/flavodoxin
MSKNIIFFFSGTGNSLKVVKDLAKEMQNCEIVSMGSSKEYDLQEGYETIGFVYPTYFRGEPLKVREFISNLNLKNNADSYYYAITTCGRYDGNALVHIKNLLKRKNITLHYAKMLDMFSNYVVAYDMRDTINEETKQSEKDFIPIIQSIKNKETNKLPAIEPFQEIAYMVLSKFAPNMDKNYNVSDACVGCGVCEKVCPVDNISLGDDHKPYFKHHCEQCVACIQYCPQQAINYKNKTQNRKRYTNPSIKYTDLAKFNNFSE